MPSPPLVPQAMLAQLDAADDPQAGSLTFYPSFSCRGECWKFPFKESFRFLRQIRIYTVAMRISMHTAASFGDLCVSEA